MRSTSSSIVEHGEPEIRFPLVRSDRCPKVFSNRRTAMSILTDTGGARGTLHGKAHPRREKVLYVRHLTAAEILYLIDFDTHEDDNVDDVCTVCTVCTVLYCMYCMSVCMNV